MAKAEIVIEEASNQDAPALHAFFKQIALESDLTSLAETGLDLSVDQLAAYLESSSEKLDQLFLLVRLEDKVLAVLNLTTDPNPRLSHVGQVFIAVAKPYWKQGLGSLLFEVLLDWLEQSPSIRRLELTVQERNLAARALYEKFGFAYEGRQEEAILTQGQTYETVLLMGKKLDRKDHV